MDYFSLDKNITAGVQRRIPARFGGIEVQKTFTWFFGLFMFSRAQTQPGAIRK